MRYLLTIAAIVAALTLTGCIPDYNKTTNDYSDNSINYGDGTVLNCNDSNCSVAPEGTDEGDGDAVVGVYSADYSQTECTAAGFFYCTLDNVCLNQAAIGGSCN